MRRALRLLLVREPADGVERLAAGKRRKRRDLVRVLVVLTVRTLLLEREVHDLEEALEVDFGRARRKEVVVRERWLAGRKRHGADGRLRVGHLARHEALPHECVELELRRVHAALGGAVRREQDIGRAYRLVGALRVGLGLEEVGAFGVELPAEGRGHVFLRRRARLLGDVHGVGSHVGDAPLFVKRLRELHRLPGRERKDARRRLLHRRRGERRQRVARLRLGLQVDDLELGAGEVEKRGVGSLAVAHVRLLAVDSRKFRDELAVRGAALLRLDAHEEVGLGLERLYLALALDEEPQSDRLDAARGERAVVGARDVLPEERRHLVADNAVEDPARLLRVDERHVDVARLGNGLENCVLGDLVVGDAMERLLAGDGLEHFLEVPRDRLPFAVGIACEIDFARRLDGGLEFRDDLLLAFRDFVLRRERPALVARLVDPYRAVLLREIADVADGTLDRELRPEILAYRLRLSGRLDYQQLLAHAPTISFHTLHYQYYKRRRAFVK